MSELQYTELMPVQSEIIPAVVSMQVLLKVKYRGKSAYVPVCYVSRITYTDFISAGKLLWYDFIILMK